MTLLVDLFLGAAVAAGALLCWLGYESYRRWDEPGAAAFGAFAVVWGLNPIVSGLAAVVWSGAGVLSGLLWVVVVVPWFLFALRYTGTAFRRRTVVALVVPTLGLVPWGLGAVSGGGAGLVRALGIMVFTYYSALATVGALLVVRATQKYGHLSLPLGLCLAVAGVLPAVTMNTFGILLESAGEVVLFGIYAAGIVGVLVTVGLALFVFDMFETTPAAGSIGERAIPRETDDCILIVDDEERLITRNEAAERTLAAHIEPAGAPLPAALDVGIGDLETTDTIDLRTADGVRKFDPQVTALTDQHGRRLGSMVSLRDVTDREMRRQRLEVLNRILRHNLRNQVGVIKANTEVVADAVEDEVLQAHLENTTQSADSLQDLGRKAKTIEELLSEPDGPTADIDLGSFLADIVDDANSQWPAAQVTMDGADGRTRIETDPELVRFVVENLLENAVEHADREQPQVEVWIERDAEARYPTTIAVADDGPGIPDREVEVLQEGGETPLKHGSGVGLWVTNWAVTDLGGELSFDRREPRGTVARVGLPHELLGPEQQEHA